MARILHVALWVRDLEGMKDFYTQYFGGKAGERYENPKKQFSSYFIQLEQGASLELMYKEDLRDGPSSEIPHSGWAHIALGLGSEASVLMMTEKLREAGFHIAGEPRITGDGFFESVILDPEGNRVELTI